MSVDQTSQLIQLMLNSVLMMALCGGVAIGLIVRQSAIVSQMRLLKPLYSDALNGVRLLAPEHFFQIKAQLRLLRRHYRLIRIACWTASVSVVLCAGSTLLLALRTLVLLDRLIPVSLLLFTLGAALLLLSLILGLLSLVEASSAETEPEPRHDLKELKSKELKSGRSGSPLREARSLPAPLPWSQSGHAPSRSQPQYPPPYQP